jgi:hypothetical protein
MTKLERYETPTTYCYNFIINLFCTDGANEDPQRFQRYTSKFTSLHILFHAGCDIFPRVVSS